MKTSLQVRLISALVLFTLFLISAFTAIQLNNQIQKTREFNLYQTRQEALVARTRLEELFAVRDENKALPHNVLMAETKNVFALTLESGVIETVSLLDKTGYPVILEGNLKLFFEDDKIFIQNLSDTKNKTKWMVPLIDKTHKLVNLFVTFRNPYGYILKFTFSLSDFQKALSAVYVPIIFTVAIVVIGNVILGALLSWMVISPIKILNEATKDVASGNLDLKIRINTKDELEELSETFNYMTVELKKMKSKAENANPLTKLPGNIVIQEEVEKRLKWGKEFVLIYCDLDHFKAFNDRYGVHAGDKAIMLTADVFKEAIAKEGQEDDFIGHEGGDDFLILTVPDRSDKMASYIIREFDKRIRGLYAKEDLDRGFIEAKGRESDQMLKFPIMTLSLSGVSNVKRDIDSYSQLTNIAAEVKKIAKKTKGSKFIMDRRTEDLGSKVRDDSHSA